MSRTVLCIRHKSDKHVDEILGPISFSIQVMHGKSRQCGFKCEHMYLKKLTI